MYNYFGSPGQWIFLFLLVGLFGYGAIRSCEAGCGYFGRHVNIEWVK